MKNLIFGQSEDTFPATILRIFAGLSMAFGHGLGKIPPSEGFITMLDKEGVPMAIVFAWAAGLSEFLGGLFLAAGFATRASGLFLFITMMYAAFIHHGADPFSGKEKALLYGAIALYFAIKGGGRQSLDGFIRK